MNYDYQGLTDPCEAVRACEGALTVGASFGDLSRPPEKPATPVVDPKADYARLVRHMAMRVVAVNPPLDRLGRSIDIAAKTADVDRQDVLKAVLRLTKWSS
ncbi:MAG: hypothetical protein CMK32_09715 [Porticoccaceae bacterium]|nr:hypothetical protein [Porticoccaceae bacterium]